MVCVEFDVWKNSPLSTLGIPQIPQSPNFEYFCENDVIS